MLPPPFHRLCCIFRTNTTRQKLRGRQLRQRGERRAPSTATRASPAGSDPAPGPAPPSCPEPVRPPGRLGTRRGRPGRGRREAVRELQRPRLAVPLLEMRAREVLRPCVSGAVPRSAQARVHW